MEVKASLRNYRISARKARLVSDEVRNKGVEEALNILAVSPKKFAKPLSKLLHSAVANAESKNDSENAGLDVDQQVHQPYGLMDKLPWDHVNVKYGRGFLEKEQNRATIQLAAMADADDGDKIHIQIDLGFRHDMSVGPQESGQVCTEVSGLGFCFDAASSRRAEGLEIDFRSDGDETGFKLENPNKPKA